MPKCTKAFSLLFVVTVFVPLAPSSIAIVQSLQAQTVPAAKPPASVGRDDIDALKTGKEVTLMLVGGKKVQGTVTAKTADRVQLRVGHGLFRYRTEAYPLTEIVSVKKRKPAWVGPVVVLGVVGAVVIGVSACVASGACLR